MNVNTYLYDFSRALHLLKLNLIMCSGQSSQMSQNIALKKKQQHTWSSRFVQCSGCCWTIQLFLLQSITPFCSECCMLRLSSEEHFALLVLLKGRNRSYANMNKLGGFSYQHFASCWETAAFCFQKTLEVLKRFKRCKLQEFLCSKVILMI